MQDLEFTVEQGKLWMLQTRNGKRTAKAALRIAVELANEKLITRDEAVVRIDPASLDQLLHPTIDPNAERNVIATGLPASPARPRARSCFVRRGRQAQGDGARSSWFGSRPRPKTSRHARRRRILTTRGGMTSHAAVVARGMGKPCVSGAGTIRVDYAAQTMTPATSTLKRGELITIGRLDRPGAVGRARWSSRRCRANSAR